MTRKDFQVIAEMLGQIAFSEECLGAKVIDNKGAIDYHLKSLNPNYSSEKFWQAVERAKQEIKALTD